MAGNPDQPTRRSMTGHQFDPFSDRAARDIRNRLAEAFVAAWQGAGSDYITVAANLSQRHGQPAYRAYVSHRLEAYRAAVEDRRQLDDPGLLDEVIVLWNRGLFFYVHREAGREPAAARLGRRASARLEHLRPHVKAIANLDTLIGALATSPSKPPVLRGNGN